MIEIEHIPAVRAWRAAQAEVTRWAHLLRQLGNPAQYPQYMRALEGAQADVKDRHEKAALAIAAIDSDERWLDTWMEHGRRRIAKIEAMAGQALSAIGKAEIMAMTKAELEGSPRGH